MFSSLCRKLGQRFGFASVFERRQELTSKGRARRFRPRCEHLEDRLAPAWDLLINATTSGITPTVGGGTATFTATATGQHVNVTDILAQLTLGNDVVINNGATGSQTGDITWQAASNLTWAGGATRSLQIQFHASSLAAAALNLNSVISATGPLSVLNLSGVNNDIVNVFSTARIQNGVDFASAGATVNIKNGTYLESNILVTKSMSILGQSQTGVIVAPAGEDDNVDSSFGGTFQNGFVVSSNNVTIKTLTLDGQGNGALTAGKNNYRAGIITDFFYNPGPFGHLDVENVTVKNVYRRGIQVSDLGTGNIINNNTINGVTLIVSGEVKGYAIATFGGDATIKGNTITNAVGGISTNFADTVNGTGPPLCTIQGNSITGPRIGMSLNGLFEGSLVGGPLVADANTIDMTPGSTTDIGMTVAFVRGNVTVQKNTITGKGADSGIWLYNNTDSTKPVLVVGNTLTTSSATAANAGEGVGILVTDDQALTSDAFDASYATIKSNTISGWTNGISLWRNGTTVAGGFPVVATIGGATVADSNNIGGSVNAGIYVFDADNAANGYDAVATVTGNNIHNNNSGIQLIGGSATVTRNQIQTSASAGIYLVNSGNLVSASENFITGNVYGVYVDTVTTAGIVGSISGNDLSGNTTKALVNNTGTPIDASANWWGSNTTAGVQAQITGPVDFTPWLDVGTDTAPATPGFQGSFALLHVDDASPQTGVNGRIQEGVNLVSASGTVDVKNGLYKESNILVSKAESIIGESQTGVIVAPAGEDDNIDSSFGGTFQNGFVVSSNNVTIKTLTLDGQGNTGLTVGKNNYRAGIITDFFYNPGPFDHLDVENVTVKNVYRRGIQVSDLGTGNVINNNTINGVTLADNGYAIITFGGDATIKGNTITNAVGGIATNFADTVNGTGPPLCTIQGNSITGARIGMNLNGLFEGSLVGGPLPADANTIDMTPGSTTDIGMTVAFVRGNVTVRNNIITGKDKDSAIWLYNNTDPSKPVLVIGNNITSSTSTATNAGEGEGILLTDDQTLTSDAFDASYATIKGNTITGWFHGISLFRNGTSAPGGFPVVATIGGTAAADSNDIGANGVGIFVFDADNSANGYDAVATVTGNNIHGTTNGVLLWGGSATLSRNKVQANTYGIASLNGGDLVSASQNFITGNTYGVHVSTNTSAGIVGSIFANDLSGNATKGVWNTTGAPIDASGNWWGSNTTAGVQAQVTSDVDFTPWLDVGTDIDADPTNGFQGNFSVLHVDDDSPQTGVAGRITEAITDLFSPGTINVHNGSYTENVDAATPPKAVTLAPGASPGQVNLTGNLTLNGNDTLAFELNGTTAGTGYDQFVVSGNVTLNNATLSVTRGFDPAVGTSFKIIDGSPTSTITGTFNGLPEGATIVVNNVPFVVSYLGHDVTLTLAAPTTVWVNDNWVVTTDIGPGGLSYGDIVANTGTGDDGTVTGKVFGVNAFATIQAGINAVASAGTVFIIGGTYTENVSTSAKAVTLAPGDSPAQVTINGNLTLDANDKLAIELNGTAPGTQYDQVVVSGTVTLGGATLLLSRAFLPTQGTTFTIIDGSVPISGTLTPNPVFAGGVRFDITYTGNDVTLTVNNPSDNFNRADNASLGGNWTAKVGAFGVQGNQAVGNAPKTPSNPSNLSVFNPIAAAQDVAVEAKVSVPVGGHVGLVARYQGSGDNNMYLGTVVSAGTSYTARIYRITNGSFRQLAIGPAGPTGTLQFELIGESLKLYFNGQVVASTVDSSLSAAGLVGIRGSLGSNLDDFAATAITSILPFADTFDDRPASVNLGGNWTQRGGNFDIVNVAGNNLLSAQANGSNYAVYNEAAAIDVAVRASVNLTSGAAGLAARYLNDGTLYLGRLNQIGSNVHAQILRILGGQGATLVDQLVLAPAAGTLEFKVVGSLLTLSLNGSIVARAIDSSIRTRGLAGVYAMKNNTLDNFNVSQVAFAPFSDSFNRADNQDPGPNWVKAGGNFAIQSNALAATGSTLIGLYTGGSAADVAVEANVTLNGKDEVGVIARFQNATSMYLGRLKKSGPNTLLQIVLVQGTSQMVLATETLVSPPATGLLHFEVQATSLSLSYPSATTLTATNTVLKDPGLAGVRGSNGTTFDNFSLVGLP